MGRGDREPARRGKAGGEQHTVHSEEESWSSCLVGGTEEWLQKLGSLHSACLQPPPLPGLHPCGAEWPGLRRGNLDLRQRWKFGEGGAHRAGLCHAWRMGVAGAHLVKEAVLADELLSGLGVDGDGEPHVCHQELGREPGKTSEKAWLGPLTRFAPPLEPSAAPPSPLWRHDARAQGGSKGWHAGLHC